MESFPIVAAVRQADLVAAWRLVVKRAEKLAILEHQAKIAGALRHLATFSHRPQVVDPEQITLSRAAMKARVAEAVAFIETFKPRCE